MFIIYKTILRCIYLFILLNFIRKADTNKELNLILGIVMKEKESFNFIDFLKYTFFVAMQ